MDELPQGLGAALPKKGAKPPRAAGSGSKQADALLKQAMNFNIPAGMNIDPEAAQAALQGALAHGGIAGVPGLAGALQQKLNMMIGRDSGFLEELPGPVKRRVSALKELQEEYDEKKAEFKKELEALEAKYEELYAPIFKKRAAHVDGSVPAPEKEEGDDDEKEAAAEDGEEEKTESEEGTQGIPDFWLCALRNCEDIAEQITEKDEAVLKYLKDISTTKLTQEDGEPDEELEEGEEPVPVIGFKLVFHFLPNPFFKNALLEKKYFMVDDDDPILERSKGTEIEWNPNKNVTVKLMKKKSKSSKGKSSKPQMRMEKCDSFFNFFSPPEVPDMQDELEEEEAEKLQEAMESDYELGDFIKTKLVPQAILWFTGEALEEYEDGEEEEEEEEEGDEEEDEDDEEEDGEEGGEGKEEQPECKQQ